MAARIKYPQLQDKQWLEQKYKDEKLSTVQIAKLIDGTASAVLSALKRHEISTRSMSKAAKNAPRKLKNELLSDPEWLRKQYIDNKLTTYQVAKLADTNQKAVCTALKYHRIKARSMSRAKKLQNKLNPLESKYEQLNNREWLKQKYSKEKLSSIAIAEEIGCYPETVILYLNKYKIKIRDYVEASFYREYESNFYPKLNDREWLHQKYIVEEKSTREIAKLAGAKTPNSARQALLRHDIEVRDIHDGLATLRENDHFDMHLPTIEGSLLGDAYMGCYDRTSENSYPFFQKHNIYYDHVSLVAKNLFGEYWEDRITEGINKFRGKEFPYFAVRSYSYKELKPMHQKWYPESNGYKKIVPLDLKLTPEHVLHWFMDDGSTSWRKRKYKNSWTQKTKQIDMSFSSESFTKKENEYLISELDRLGIKSTLRKVKTGTGWRIRVSSTQVNDFFDLIGECPVSSMKYKWKRLDK